MERGPSSAEHCHYTEKEGFLATGMCGDTLEGFGRGWGRKGRGDGIDNASQRLKLMTVQVRMFL